MGGYKSVQDYFLDYFLELPNVLTRVCVNKLEGYLNGLLPNLPVFPSICDTKLVPWFECGVQESGLENKDEGREKELRRKTCHFF